MEIENEIPVTARPLPQNIWVHGLITLVLLALTHLALMLLGACGVIQFFWMLFAKERNEHIVAFGKGLANWLNLSAGFVTGKSEDKPFPWTQWGS